MSKKKVETKDIAVKKDVEIEKELRRYIKKSGGFKKDISKEDKKKAEVLLKQLGRNKPKWDLDLIPIPSPFKI